MEMIQTEKLVYEYEKRDEEGNVIGTSRAIDEVDIEAKEGQFIAILGHNGSGKSTLAKHLNAILMPTEGSVWVNGKNTSNPDELWNVRQSAGMVFQNPDNQIIGINTILDPLFIFGFGWGIRGAAIATVLAQVISLVWQLRILSNKQELLHFRRGIYRLRKKIVRDMLAIGMSPFLMNLAACFIVILINKGLKEYGGDLMIGAYGIVNRLAFFFVMIVLGVNQGMQPIAGYNFGAKQYDRVMRVLKLTMIGATCVTTAGFLLGEFMPRLAVGMFTSDEELIRLAVEGMRIVFFCFPIIGFQMVATNFFMSIGMAGKAIFLSLSRQLLFLMPGLIFLPHIFDVCTEWNGSWGVWCSMPLSDFLASLVAFFMLTYQLRKFRAIGAENAAKEG